MIWLHLDEADADWLRFNLELGRQKARSMYWLKYRYRLRAATDAEISEAKIDPALIPDQSTVYVVVYCANDGPSHGEDKRLLIFFSAEASAGVNFTKVDPLAPALFDRCVAAKAPHVEVERKFGTR